MNNNFFTSPSNDGLIRVLNVADLRQKLILNNIANSRTPGYVAKDIDFVGYLQKSREDKLSMQSMQMERTDDGHLACGGLNNEESPFQLDGTFASQFIRFSQPDEEQDMVNLAENSLTYKAAAELLSRQYQILSTSITGGVR